MIYRLQPTPAGSLLAVKQPNKVEVALAVREAMREHRKGKPIVFSDRRYPRA